ncbi:helix-turn-helix domain-containing protein [Nocardia fluminea]|uniref:helix-turn-helix domain-containing protein n=1 Tax=Nocardia fluminea TaxID=134984 RepID=UPI003419B877
MPTNNRAQPDERDRQSKALGLRLEGHTYAKIADELGYSESGAYRAVEAILKRVESAGAAELRKVETLRLEALFHAWWTPAIGGDEKAAGVVLRCHDRLVKLHGLAMPEKLDITVDKDAAAFDIAASLAAIGYVAPVTPIEVDTEPWSNIE